jgi:hypothetical protein
MTTTMPPGPQTNLRSAKCYAGALRDCDGHACTREHFFSENLLNRIGDEIDVTGLPWFDGTRTSKASELVANVLCERHNNALSPVDSTIGLFYDALRAFYEGREIEAVVDGEHLERWALKVWFGIMSSGNLRRPDGARVRQVPTPPQLLYLFGYEELPEGWGLHVLTSPGKIMESDTEFHWNPNTYGPGHPEAGAIFGSTVQLMAFSYMTALSKVRFGDNGGFYRPGGLAWGRGGLIHFRWRRPGAYPYLKMSGDPAVLDAVGR